MLRIESAADRGIIWYIQFPTGELLSLLGQYALSAQWDINLGHSDKAAPFPLRKQWTAFAKHRVHVSSTAEVTPHHRLAERSGKTNPLTTRRGRVARHHRLT